MHRYFKLGFGNLRKRKLFLVVVFNCVVAVVSVYCFFLVMPWVGLLSVIVAFTGHNHLLLHMGRDVTKTRLRSFRSGHTETSLLSYRE